jgi:hypothetical protein
MDPPVTPTRAGVYQWEADVIEPELARVDACDEVVTATRADVEVAGRIKTQWQARHQLAQFRAETERLRVLVEFLGRPIHAHGGTEPDPDIVTAYNLAVEAALLGIRRASGT